MSKNNKTPFQLKPKHLIRALFLVSFIAVAALVAGVFSTLNSGKTDVPEKSPAEQNDTRIEVWRPNGTVEPETVQPAKDGDAKTASGNPVVPQDEKGEKAKEGVKKRPPHYTPQQTHRKQTRRNRQIRKNTIRQQQPCRSKHTSSRQPAGSKQSRRQQTGRTSSRKQTGKSQSPRFQTDSQSRA